MFQRMHEWKGYSRFLVQEYDEKQKSLPVQLKFETLRPHTGYAD